MTAAESGEKEALKKKNALEKSALSIVDETLNIGANRLREEHVKVCVIVIPLRSALWFETAKNRPDVLGHLLVPSVVCTLCSRASQRSFTRSFTHS